MMYRSQPCLPFFSAVVKNVANPSVAIKKLVYLYLLQYAEQEPDLALLSINTIQKSLSDQSPQIRAMALRVMSGIRVPVISQIVSLAIKKGCADMSPIVRKVAALAIPKCYRLDPSTQPQLVQYIALLLGDKQYFVIGSAAVAFLELCPDRIDLIHKHYRGLVKKLVDMDEWGQLALMKMLTNYARKCFPRRTERVTSPKVRAFYEDEEVGSSNGEGEGRETAIVDLDLESFLSACETLLTSRNSAVIVAAVRCILHLGTAEHLKGIAGPLIALLRGPSDTHEIILYNIVVLCLTQPALFVPYISHFFIRLVESPQIWRLKLEILTLIFPHCGTPSKGLILNELEHFTDSSEPDLVRESVRAIGRCAQTDTSTSPWCLNLLLRQISSPDENLVAEVLTVVRHLVQQDPSAHSNTIIQLAKNLDSIASAEGRATVIWLVGEFASGGAEEESIAPDMLRILVKGFADEMEIAKSQIVLLAAKVCLHHLNARNARRRDGDDASTTQNDTAIEEAQAHPERELDQRSEDEEPQHPIVMLWQHTLLLVRYDTSYDLRDRTRLYRNLLEDSSKLELANLVLLVPKPVPQVPSPSESRRDLLLGSATLVIGQDAGPTGLDGYEKLPDWIEAGEEPDPQLRDELMPRAISGSKGAVPAGQMLDLALEEKVGKAPAVQNTAKQKTLNDWLDEEGDDAVEGGSEEEEGDGEEEDDESEEESDEDGSDESSD